MTIINESKKEMQDKKKVITEEIVMRRAVRLLRVRQLTKKELRDKLYTEKMPYPLILSVLETCERLGYINDQTAVESRFQTLLQKGIGVERIKRELSHAGFSDELLDDTLAEQTINESEMIKKWLERKWKSWSKEGDFDKAKTRAIRFLLARGFSYDAILSLLEEQH